MQNGARSPSSKCRNVFERYSLARHAERLNEKALCRRVLERIKAGRIRSVGREVKRFDDRIEKRVARGGKFFYERMMRFIAEPLNGLYSRFINREEAVFKSEASARRVFSKIRGYIKKGESVLDVGCGKGLLGKLIFSELGNAVHLLDISEKDPDAGLSYKTYDGKTIPFEGKSFDAVVLVNVLHHANDPRALLKEVARVAKKRVIIVEYTYFNVFHRLANCLIDLRTLVLSNPNANVPLNFMQWDAWVKVFDECGKTHGFSVVEVKHLGIVRPGVPEWQTLYVLEKSS